MSNRLLIIASVMILLGMTGLALTGAFAPYQGYGNMFPMMGMMDMMDRGMMGQGMMSRGHMREMMQRMMPGMLPPGLKPENLPDPASRGARKTCPYPQ